MGVSRCKKGAYLEKKQGQVLLQLGSNLPCPRHFLTTLPASLSLPKTEGFPNSLTLGKKDRKPHPGAQHLVPGEKVPVVSPNLVPRLAPG